MVLYTFIKVILIKSYILNNLVKIAICFVSFLMMININAEKNFRSSLFQRNYSNIFIT